MVHQLPVAAVVLAVVSVVVAVGVTVGSGAVAAVPATVEATVAAVSLVVVSVVVVAGSVVLVVAGATKLRPLDDPDVDEPAATVVLLTVAVSLLVVAVPLGAVSPAPGLEPAVTLKLYDPSPESSHGADDVGAPPSRLAPMT